jgi:hypothetical protein
MRVVVVAAHILLVVPMQVVVVLAVYSVTRAALVQLTEAVVAVAVQVTPQQGKTSLVVMEVQGL